MRAIIKKLADRLLLVAGVSGSVVIYASSCSKEFLTSSLIYLAIQAPLLICGWLYYSNKLQCLNNKADIDELTGMYRKEPGLAHLDKELAKLERVPAQKSFSVLLMDLDNFKYLNDTYGHLAGDTVLIQVGKTIRKLARPYDTCVRFGGEEFLIVLPDTNESEAVQVAERMRMAIERLKEIHLIEFNNLSVSIGVTTGKEADSRKSVIERADEALYLAKHRGKNKVIKYMQQCQHKRFPIILHKEF